VDLLSGFVELEKVDLSGALCEVIPGGFLRGDVRLRKFVFPLNCVVIGKKALKSFD
jgi:hypothetical protein